MATGVYVHNGSGYVLKNNDTVRNRSSNYGESEVYVHNGSGYQKVYPREQTAHYPSSAFGGIGLKTYAERYSVSYWGDGFAQQGCYYASDGRGSRRLGNIFWRNGKPSAPGRIIGVRNARLNITRSAGGNANSTVVGILGMSPAVYNNRNAYSFNGCRDFTMANRSISFTIQPQNVLTTITGDFLNTFILDFLNNSGANSLCLFNNEYVSYRWSTNYMRTYSVDISMDLVYEA